MGEYELYREEQRSQRAEQRALSGSECGSPSPCVLFVLDLSWPGGRSGLIGLPTVKDLAWNRTEEVVGASRTFQFPGPVIFVPCMFLEVSSGVLGRVVTTEVEVYAATRMEVSRQEAPRRWHDKLTCDPTQACPGTVQQDCPIQSCVGALANICLKAM